MAPALTTLGFGALVIPGAVLAWRLSSARPFHERLVLALAGGLALATICSYLCAMVGSLLLAIPLLIAVAVFALRRWPAGPQPEEPTDFFALAAIGLGTLWFALPVARQPLPQGWDPAFHVPLIELIRSHGGIPATWAPYEPLDRFNYPSGLHALAALAARLSGSSAELSFTVCFILTAALTIGVVYALGRRFGGNARVGLLAVLVYSLTEGFGTPRSHASWGGWPNLAGLALMSAFFLALAAPSWRTVVLSALFAAAMAFMHHLSFVLLGFSVAMLVVLELLTERRTSLPGRSAFGGMVVAGLTAGVLVLLNPNGRYEAGQGFRFTAERMLTLGGIWDVMGAPMLVAGMMGLVIALATHRTDARRLLPAWTIALLSFWLLFDVVYRGGAYLLTHQSFSAFTPSRGLTDAAVPLAVCAGLAIDRLFSWVRVPWLGPILAAIGLVALGWHSERAQWQAGADAARPFGEARAFCQEVRTRTPADAIIYAPNAGAVGIWLPYLCGREFNYFPEPTYGMGEYRERKANIPDPREFMRYVTAKGARPVFFATRGRASFPVVANVAGWNLYRVEP